MTGHVLVASYDVPRFDRDSGSRRIWDLTGHLLDAGWRVTYLAVNRVRGGDRYVRALQRRGVAVYEGEAAGDHLVATGCFDLALFGFWQVAELFLPLLRRRSPGTRVVIDSIDVQFVRYVRRAVAASGARSLHLLDADDGAEIVGELNAYMAADAVLCVSDAERALLANVTGDPALAFTVPDQEDLGLGTMPFADRRGILFVGSFRWAPNVDAAQYLCQDVVPRIDARLLAQHPVSLVGDGLGDPVRALTRGVDHVVPVGWVPSLEPYLGRARVTVAPLRYGAGTKRKTIQALSAGTPMVASSIGAEGLDLVDGAHVLVADDPAAFAAQIERLLTDERLWQHLRAEGRRHVEERRSSEVARRGLAHVLDAVAGRPARGEPTVVADGDDRGGRYRNRLVYQSHQAALPAAREVLRRHVPAGSVVLVVSGGLACTLQLDGVTAWHFPRSDDGSHRDIPPDDSAGAIGELDRLRALGAEYLWVPMPNASWRERVPGLIAALREENGEVADEAGFLYRLGPRHTTARGPAGDVRVAEATPRPAPGPLAPDRAPELIAFYLPQYHPIPENDGWWGDGFTDWRNVARAAPLFPGHRQPHLPADLGFYDLRLPEARAAQAELARGHGIGAFCYYHYWFGGKMLLERPFDEVLASGEPDFPFCLCWANEPWSRRWDGREHDVLQPQAYGEEDDLAHIRWLLPALADRRAVRVAGKPLLLIYQAWALPNAARTAEVWRREVERAGLGELHLVAVETGWDANRDVTDQGFDAKVLFQPQFSILAQVPQLPTGPESLRVFDYDTAWRRLCRPDPVDYHRYETVAPMWDNTARRGADGWVLHGSTPESYEEWLTGALVRAMDAPPGRRLVFLNAWNEWAEGCHLEPDVLHGRSYLEATARALATATAGAGVRAVAAGAAPA